MPIKFRTWADHSDEAGKLDSRSVDRVTERDTLPASCCKKRIMAADMLVYVGHLPTPTLNKIKARMQAAWDRAVTRGGSYGLGLESPSEIGLYLCDGCRETLRREKIVPKADLPNWKLDSTSAMYINRFGGG